MKRLALIALLFASSAFGFIQIDDTHDQNIGGTKSFTPFTFGTLNVAPTDGSVHICSDCVQADPCAGGGDGAWARYVGGRWQCGQNIPATPTPAPTSTPTPTVTVTPTSTSTPTVTPTATASSAATDPIGWRPAGACDDATAASLWDLPAFASSPSPVCNTGSNTQKGALSWPDSDGDYYAELTEQLPASFSSLDARKIEWYSVATSGNVVWQIATCCVAEGESQDCTYNTASTVTDAAQGTTLFMNTASITGITTTGCAANEVIHIKFLRNRGHASDTITGVVSLIGVDFKVNP